MATSGMPGLPPTIGPGARQGQTFFFEEKFEGGHRFSTTDGNAPWLVTYTGGTPTDTFAFTDVLGGALQINTDGDDNDVTNVQTGEYVQLAAGRNFTFFAEMAVADISEAEIFVGCAISDTTLLAGATDLFGFYCQNNTDLYAITRKNGSASEELGSGTSGETKTDTGVDLADTTYVRLCINVEGTGKIKFYVNEDLVATHTTNIPDDELLAISFEVRKDGGTDEDGIIFKYLSCGPFDRD